MPSIIRQIELGLQAVTRFGEPKHEQPPEIRTRFIYSTRSLENYLDTLATWARWCQQNSVELTKFNKAEGTGQPYVQHLIDARWAGSDGSQRGYSGWTIDRAIQGLQKLEWAIWYRWHRRVTLIRPEDLVGKPLRTLGSRRPNHGPYPLAVLTDLRMALTLPYRRPVEAMLQLGLRRHEVVLVRPRDIDWDAVSYKVKGRDGSWEVHPLPELYRGVLRVPSGKGGRPREIGIPLHYRAALREQARRVPDADSRLWPVAPRELHREVYETAGRVGIMSHGVHGLRHNWSQATYDALRRLGMDDTQARRTVSHWLGHGRLQVTFSYIPREAWSPEVSWTIPRTPRAGMVSPR